MATIIRNHCSMLHKFPRLDQDAVTLLRCTRGRFNCCKKQHHLFLRQEKKNDIQTHFLLEIPNTVQTGIVDLVLYQGDEVQ